MKKGKIIIFTITLMATIFMFGCSKGNSESFPKNNGKINVATSFYIMNDFASKIGGDKINLINLVPSGMEPHDFEPKTRDITRLKAANVFIYNGAGMEGWVDKVLESADNKDMVVVEASKGIKLLNGNNENKEQKDTAPANQNDPHVWLNPQNAIAEMSAIKDAFIKADPKNKSYYEQNFESYKSKFNELDNEFKTEVGSFKQKDIVVAHAAFGYLCNAYGLKQVAIEGLNAESEPSPARMAEISKFAKDNNVKVIFFEELVSPKVAETIAKEAGAKTDMLNPIEGLSEDDKNKGKEYISIMKDNLETLKNALK